MKNYGILSVLAVALVVMLGGCSTAPKTAAKRASLHQNVLATISSFKLQDSSMQQLFDESSGYPVFPTIGKGAIGVGGAYGRGELFEDGAVAGLCDRTP